MVVVRNTLQIGNALKNMRFSASISQNQLAERSGLRQASISQIESGSKGVRLESLFKIIAALDLELVIQKRIKSK